MTLSIIIPTLNAENYVGRLLQSLCEQTYKDFEVIVVDGQSEDDTISAAAKFADKLKLRVINSPKRNVAYQRNLGAANARGELLLFLDADIILKNNFLECCIAEFNSRCLDVASCYLRPMEGRQGVLNIFRIWDILVWQLFFNAILCVAQYTYPVSPGGGTFVKKWVHEKVGGFDETIKLAEDHEYAKRTAKFAKFRILRKTMFVSMRREDTDGRVRVLVKYVLATFHKFFFGEIRSDVFKYQFGHYKK